MSTPIDGQVDLLSELFFAARLDSVISVAENWNQNSTTDRSHSVDSGSVLTENDAADMSPVMSGWPFGCCERNNSGTNFKFCTGQGRVSEIGRAIQHGDHDPRIAQSLLPQL